MSCYEAYVTESGIKRCVPDHECPSCQIWGLEQRVSAMRALLEEVLSEVPHGWGDSFSDSDLAGRIRQELEDE